MTTLAENMPTFTWS